MKNLTQKMMFAAAAMLLASQALANPCPPGNPPTNCAPAPGAILDLAGTAVPHEYTRYTTSFVAAATTTNLSFAFREDPAFLFLDDVSLRTGSGGNLVVNGGFESGVVGANAPVGWTYLNAFGAAAAGVVGGGALSGSNAYVDGAVQAYDGITQAISTVIGTTYNLEFWLNDNSSLTTFRQLSNNGNTTNSGGNGIDVLVYAGAIPTLTPPVPEPETYALMLLGMAAIGAVKRRKKA